MTGLNNRDYPVIQSGILIISGMFAVIVLIVDVVFAMVDPRIRSQYSIRRNKRGANVMTETKPMRTKRRKQPRLHEIRLHSERISLQGLAVRIDCVIS